MTYLAEFRVRKTNEKIKISRKNPPYFLSEKSSKVEETFFRKFHEIFIRLIVGVTIRDVELLSNLEIRLGTIWSYLGRIDLIATTFHYGFVLEIYNMSKVRRCKAASVCIVLFVLARLKYY